jgi:hypothetical protein
MENRRLYRLVLGSALALVLALGAVAASPDPAFAATGNIRTPFATGGQVYVYQGYNSGTHTGTSKYGLDLTNGTSATSTAGRTVVAPQAGTVAYWQPAYGNLCVNTSSGRSYTLTHIDASVTSGAVTAGQTVGKVAAAGYRNNNNVAHLHFEYWGSPNCYNSNVLAFSSANSLRICGAPDLTTSGSGSNGAWSGTIFTADACGKAFTTAPTPSVTATSKGAALKASAGSWSPTPSSLTYQWLRSGNAISGKTSSTYTLAASDFLTKVSVRVTAKRSGYTTTSKTSAGWFVAKVTSAGGAQYVTIRSSASSGSTNLGKIYSGALVALRCYSTGSTVTGPYGASTIWYKVTGVGWVSDAYLETGSNSAVTAKC